MLTKAEFIYIQYIYCKNKITDSKLYFILFTMQLIYSADIIFFCIFLMNRLKNTYIFELGSFCNINGLLSLFNSLLLPHSIKY